MRLTVTDDEHDFIEDEAQGEVCSSFSMVLWPNGKSVPVSPVRTCVYLCHVLLVVTFG